MPDINLFFYLEILPAFTLEGIKNIFRARLDEENGCIFPKLGKQTLNRLVNTK
jgi:hypothetical protein